MSAPATGLTIPRRPSNGPAPLSFPQERMFLLDRIMPGVPAYNVPRLLRIRFGAAQPLRPGRDAAPPSWASSGPRSPARVRGVVSASAT